MNFINTSGKLLRQAFGAVHHHGIAANSAVCNSHLAQRVSGLVSLSGKSSNDAHSSIMLVQSGSQFLPCPRQLLLEVICFQSKVIPFLLERREESRDRGERRRARAHDAGGSDGKKVVGGEGVASVGFGAVLIDVRLNQAFFVNNAYILVSRLSYFSAQAPVRLIIPDFLDATGSWGVSPETAVKAG